MANSAEFIVEMIDKITSPAQRISRSLEGINKQFEKTHRLSSMTGRQIGMMGAQKIGSKWSDATTKLGDGLMHYGKYAALAITAAGAAAAVWVTKGVVQMGMFAEAGRLAFKLLTGSAQTGDATFQRTIELSRTLGLDVEDTFHSMQKLLAMQFSPPDAEKWVKLGSDLRAVGVEASAIQRVMLDIAHVKATGKLSMRNLNMFANAGVSAQLLMEEVGKAMGTDEKGALEAMHKGKVTSAIALPALERAIMRKTHEHAAGEAGGQFANTTLTGLMTQLGNMPKLFFLKIAEQAQSAVTKLKPVIDSLLAGIDSFNTADTVKFVSAVLDMLRGVVPLVVEFAKGFMDGVGAIADVVGAMNPAKASLETARDLGHAIADAFAAVLKVVKLVGDAIIFLDKNRWIIKMVLGLTVVSTLLGGFPAILMAMASGTTAPLGGIWLLVKAWQAVRGAIMAARAVQTGAAVVGAVTTAATAAGTAAVTTAATTAGTAAAATAVPAAVGGTAVAGAGTVATAAGAGAVALAILPGLLAAGAGYIWREEIAGWMLGARTDATAVRGIATAPEATPTSLLDSAQQSAGKKSSETHVTVSNLNVNVDGKDKDAAEIGKSIGESSRDEIEQHWQSMALEQGAM